MGFCSKNVFLSENRTDNNTHGLQSMVDILISSTKSQLKRAKIIKDKPCVCKYLKSHHICNATSQWRHLFKSWSCRPTQVSLYSMFKRSLKKLLIATFAQNGLTWHVNPRSVKRIDYSNAIKGDISLNLMCYPCLMAQLPNFSLDQPEEKAYT